MTTTPLVLAPLGRERLAKMFGCQNPERMHWERSESGLHDCHGCSGRCGMGNAKGTQPHDLFLEPENQLDLFA